MRGLLSAALLATVLSSLFLFAPILAQGALAQDTADGSSPGPHVTVEVHTERPPEGTLRRGRLAAPAWAVYVGAGGLLVAAAGALAVRLRRGRRR